MSKKNLTTLYHFVLDRSGSMYGIARATISGFNKQLSTIRELEEEHEDQTYLTSLTIFNDHVDHLLDPAPSSQMKMLSHENYSPEGSTALYAAIGESIVGIKGHFKKKLKKAKMSVVMVILTDGWENSSRVYTAEKINEMMEKLRETGLWTFSILGADVDLSYLRKSIKLREQEAYQFDKSNINASLAGVSDSLRSYALDKKLGLIQRSLMIESAKDEDQ